MGDPLSCQWSLTHTPSGSAAVLLEPTTVQSTFVVNTPGAYGAQLLVHDSTTASAPDTVSINTRNSAPVAHAGPDQSPFVGDVVTLDGTGSSDVDGDVLSYHWSLTTVPVGSGARLSNPNALSPPHH